MATTARPSTIRDVAKRAGVSTATVSRALRGGAGVDPTTRARVEKAAGELRYRPSGVARSLKLGATQTIGLIVTDIENPFFPLLVRSVEDTARDRGYSVILADGRRDAAREIQSLELLARREVDGLLVASAVVTERHLDWIADRPCPLVVLNSASPAQGVPAVMSDNDAGGRQVAEHLSALGHRRFAYLGAPPSMNPAVEERLVGLRAVLDERDGSIEALGGDGGVEAAEEAAREAMTRWPDTTALVCYNDLTAVGALRGLRALGLRVPTDVSVVGFDDIELAPFVDPPLTTVRQSTDEMGRWAVSKLIEVVEAGTGSADAADGDQDARTERMPVRLVVRASTAAAAD